MSRWLKQHCTGDHGDIILKNIKKTFITNNKPKLKMSNTVKWISLSWCIRIKLHSWSWWFIPVFNEISLLVFQFPVYFRHLSGLLSVLVSFVLPPQIDWPVTWKAEESLLGRKAGLGCLVNPNPWGCHCKPSMATDGARNSLTRFADAVSPGNHLRWISRGSSGAEHKSSRTTSKSQDGIWRACGDPNQRAPFRNPRAPILLWNK